MNTAVLDELGELMDAQLEILQGLVDLAHHKTSALVTGDLAGLEALTRGEQALVWRLGRLEDRRDRLGSFIAQEMGVRPGELTLAELSRMAPAKYGHRFSAAQPAYADCLRQLQTRQEANRELLEQALDLVNFSLRAMAGAGPPAPVYGSGGRTGTAPAPTRRLDSRA